MQQQIIIKQFLHNEPGDFKKFLVDANFNDLQDIFSMLTTKHELHKFLNILRDDQVITLLNNIDAIKLRNLLNKIALPSLAYYVAMLDDSERAIFFHKLPNDLIISLQQLINYSSSQIGSLMLRNIPKLEETATVKDAYNLLKKSKCSYKQHIFIIRSTGEYIGIVSASHLISANKTQYVTELLEQNIPTVVDTSSKEDLEHVIANYYLPVIPVTNSENKLLGLIATKNLLKTIQEESIATLQSMVGVSKDEKVLSSPIVAIKKRLPWLSINLLTAFLAAFVVSLFDATISKFTALAVLLPVIAGQAGNTGAQAQAVMMRGLALKEIQSNRVYKAIYKEFFAGLLNGCVVGIITGLGVYIWSQSLGLAILLAGSMVIAMIIAALSGLFVPALLIMFKQDPAQSSSIILTTITDCTSFGIFLTLATVFIGFL